MRFPKAYADRVARLRVPGGFVLVAAFLWLARPTWTSLIIGLMVALCGLALRAWAAGHLEKNQQLADGGPYSFTRNPLYIGTLIVALGFVIASRRWELAVLSIVVFVGIYLPVVELEEQHLRTLFPLYEEYARRVPRLIPALIAPAPSKRRFRWSIYRRNEEYQALIGFLIGVAVLVWKII
jgi:protein-S-isoprenylcysteine O-methyltransferase Ste14